MADETQAMPADEPAAVEDGAPPDVDAAPEDGGPDGGDDGIPMGQISVDFVILPEGYGQTKKIDIRSQLAAVRAELESELSIPENSLFLMNMTGAVEVSGMLETEKYLYEYGLSASDKIGIELRINYYQEQAAEAYVMPDMLDLPIVDEKTKEVVKRVYVYVERPTAEKPYLGGYANKQTGQTYHHAYAQTPRPQKEASAIKYHRETQTYEYRTRSTKMGRECGTQMPKSGLFLSEHGDKFLEARKPYFSSADLNALILEKTVIIQCHARGMFARKRARQLRKERDDRLEFQAKESEKRRLEAELRHKREIERRMHPRTFEDFSVLYSELEAWRLNETKRINNSGFDEATRHAALRELLHKETKLLQTIDKLKIQAHSHNRDAKIKKSLECMAKPKVWAQSDGETTTVHTPFTTRAKELMDLYNGLRLPLLTVDERLDVLLHVKWTVKEFDCNLTRELVDLIDREADMLNRGRPEKSFVGLRRRVANLFLQFIETPEFNPEAMRYQKVPRELHQQQSTHPLSTIPIKGLGQSS
jgi:hypothetical protein